MKLRKAFGCLTALLLLLICLVGIYGCSGNNKKSVQCWIYLTELNEPKVDEEGNITSYEYEKRTRLCVLDESNVEERITLSSDRKQKLNLEFFVFYDNLGNPNQSAAGGDTLNEDNPLIDPYDAIGYKLSATYLGKEESETGFYDESEIRVLDTHFEIDIREMGFYHIQAGIVSMPEEISNYIANLYLTVESSEGEEYDKD